MLDNTRACTNDASGTTKGDILNDTGNSLDILLGETTLKRNVNTCSNKETSIHVYPRVIFTMKATSRKTVHITEFLTEKCK